jgi:hypothetical protein
LEVRLGARLPLPAERLLESDGLDDHGEDEGQDS